MIKSKSAILFFIYPSWLDIVVVFLLLITKNYFVQGVDFAIAILVLGLVRYLLQIFAIGFISYSSKNWYIKKVIYLVLSMICFLVYEQKTLTWIISLYFFELTFIELVVSLSSKNRGQR
jgi:hypothetical protein